MSKKKILLFQIFPRWRTLESDMRLPLGMLYLGNSLKLSGYDIQVFHVEESKIDATIAKINFNNILFISVCSILTGYSLRSAIKFSKVIKKKFKNIPIVWGGVQPSMIPEICLKEKFVDAIGIGEGEELIVDIAKMYEGKLNPHEIKGFAFKEKNNAIIINSRRDFIENIDKYKPDYSLINLSNYIFNGRISGLIMSSRGCPYNCSFCYNNAFNKGRWRKHSKEWVIEQLKNILSEHYFNAFSFSDDNYFVDSKRAVEMLKEANKLNLRTFSLDVKINNLTDENIKDFAKFNVESIFFGTESLNSKLIKLINKKQNKDVVINAISRFSKLAPNISVQTEILVALPFETKEEIRQDITDGLKLYKYNKNLSVYFGVLFPLPKTDIMKYAKENGFNPKSVYEYTEIDLNNVWSICDKWTLFDLSYKEKIKLYFTEKYSQLIGYDRRLKSFSPIALYEYLRVNFLFYLSKYRLKHWFFDLWRIDFFISKCSPYYIIKFLLFFVYSKSENYFQNINKKVNYLNFGYIPTISKLHNIKGKIFGHFNLIKRLQAKEIMNALNLNLNDVALDFGCGSGYMSVEMAKLSKKTYGIDISNYLNHIKIPNILKNRLEYIQVDGKKLPFNDNTFDVVLASEVLPMIENPKDFLVEIKRVLKKNGRLVISNGAGHPVIEEAYKTDSKKLRKLKKLYPDRFPDSYKNYCRILQNSFKTAQNRFFNENDIRNLLESSNFNDVKLCYSPGYSAGSFISWEQFVIYLKTGKTISEVNFINKFYYYNFKRIFEKRKYKGGIISVSKNIK